MAAVPAAKRGRKGLKLVDAPAEDIQEKKRAPLESEMCWNYKGGAIHWPDEKAKVAGTDSRDVLLNNFLRNVIRVNVILPAAKDLLPRVFFRTTDDKIVYVQDRATGCRVTDAQFDTHFPFDYTNKDGEDINCQQLMQCKLNVEMENESIPSLLKSCIYVYVVYNHDPDSVKGYRLQRYVGKAEDLFKRWDKHAAEAFSMYNIFTNVKKLLNENIPAENILENQTIYGAGEKPTMVDCMMAYAHFVKSPTALFIADRLNNPEAWKNTNAINVLEQEWIAKLQTTTPARGLNMNNSVEEGNMAAFYTKYGVKAGEWNVMPPAAAVAEE